MRDLFERIYNDKGPLGKWASIAEGYFENFHKVGGLPAVARKTEHSDCDN